MVINRPQNSSGIHSNRINDLGLFDQEQVIGRFSSRLLGILVFL